MFPMEEDDIFQVDKADLIQGPTLAELNANDESLLTDFNFDDFVMPTQMTGRNIRSANGSDVIIILHNVLLEQLTSICTNITERGR